MYEIYCKLRDQKGVKDADVAKNTGITKSTFTDRLRTPIQKSFKIQGFLVFIVSSMLPVKTGKTK